MFFNKQKKDKDAYSILDNHAGHIKSLIDRVSKIEEFIEEFFGDKKIGEVIFKSDLEAILANPSLLDEDWD